MILINAMLAYRATVELHDDAAGRLLKT